MIQKTTRLSARILCYLLMVIFFSQSCRPVYKIFYPSVDDEKMAKTSLKDLMKNNPSPNVILRVPNVEDKTVSNTINNERDKILYNVIEKELIKEGFNVRDRGLVNEVLKNTKNSNYSNIKELTNTDIIIELTDINRDILYSTNMITPINRKTGEEKPSYIESPLFISKGASVEYKVVIVKTNEIAGLYKFNYKPCASGCLVNDYKITEKAKNRYTRKGIVKEKITDPKEVDSFIKVSVKELAGALRN